MMINKDNIKHELQKLIDALDYLIKSDALKSANMIQK